jgi:hypothetical protein
VHIKRGVAICIAHNFLSSKITQQPTSTLLKMPQAKGKANYKVDALILVVKELLPNGAQGWQEVATLYQHHSGELMCPSMSLLLLSCIWYYTVYGALSLDP